MKFFQINSYEGDLSTHIFLSSSLSFVKWTKISRMYIFTLVTGENLLLVTLIQMLCLHVTYSWHADELEVFDAVEEIKQNFYVLLEVPQVIRIFNLIICRHCTSFLSFYFYFQNADSATIKKSFRKLSLTLHPDHNPSPTADQEFRNLVLVYDILKNAEKRRYYDNILENGLPDWRQAVYYYRRVRKMGLQEMSLILAFIVSIGQYLFAWASYLEKKITLVRNL